MTCASRQAAFIELAATGAEPVSELCDHLRECPSCRAILERERNLFSAIDAGLYASTHVEVPGSLLPQVRARIAERSAPGLAPYRLRKMTLAIAAAATLLLSINSLRQGKQPPVSPPPRLALPALPASDILFASAEPAIAKSSRKFFHPPVAVQQPPARLAPSHPEIIVSSDQEILLARYADQLNQRRNARAVVIARATSVEPQPLELELIQIAQLDVKPLAEQLE